ncbi:thiamine pyrophosphate-binding protein [Streptomyces diastatochromogenes]|nr:thiamine pyrophosphate-binding protein [Streptomyces diastatochromogenes]
MTHTEHLHGGDAVVSAFTAAGADHIFCSSGSEWAPVWESLARHHRDGLPCPGYLDLTHETVAVGMATGYGLITRRPQGVLLHAAPGLLQGSMAVHGALLAGVPMVVASSESTTYGDGPARTRAASGTATCPSSAAPTRSPSRSPSGPTRRRASTPCPR